jgi:hypothetical protein
MAPQQCLVHAGFKLKRINGGRAEKPATDALLIRFLLSNLGLRVVQTKRSFMNAACYEPKC